MRVAMLVVAALVGFPAVAAVPAVAAEDVRDEDYVRALSAQPGVTVTHGVEHGPKGEQAYTEWRKNGVFYRRLQGAGEDTFFGDDESGHGAVICAWMIDVLVRSALRDCSADRFADLRADLDRDIPAIEAFIVANSLVPTSAEKLRAEADREIERQAKTDADNARRLAPNSPVPQAPASPTCAAGSVGEVIESLDGLGRDGRRALMDKLLSLPRWPVTNPCL